MPHFHGLENTISAAVFGVPAVKAIEFGSGMDVANLFGSENNDAFEVRNGSVVPTPIMREEFWVASQQAHLFGLDAH